MHADFLLNGTGAVFRLMLAALLYGAWLGCASAAAAEPAASSERSGFVALILPGKSRALRPAVDAIKAGILAAEKSRSSRETWPVKIFDSGDAIEESLALFNEAKSQGAVAVIGPLTRNAVNHLADLADFSVPVLALNSFDETTLRRANLYSFGLSIEAEVEQVVRLMRSRFVVAPLVLVSDGPLSQRMQRAFVETWQQQAGAEPPVVEVYDARQQALELQQRMRDADAVFFAADGRRASRIRPYLPMDKPCFATSQIATGRTLPVDLSGVNYVEIPWLANPDAPEYVLLGRVRGSSSDIERWFAQGVDAWQLAQQLAFGKIPDTQDGLTGRLAPGADGVIARELVAKVAVTRGLPPVENASGLPVADVR